MTEGEKQLDQLISTLQRAQRDRLKLIEVQDILRTLWSHHQGQSKPDAPPVSRKWHCELSRRIGKALETIGP